MKKILSIILALTLIIGLVPTAFAEGETEATTVTYSFTTAGHDDTYTSNPERMEFARTDTKRYTTLHPSTTKGGAWAYLGTTTTSCYKSDDTYRIAYLGESFTQFILDANTYIAFKLQVPISGTYKVEDFKPYLAKNNTATDMKMYIVSMTQELERNLNATEGTAWGIKSYDTNSKTVSRTNALTFDQLGITASPLGTYSAHSGTTGVASVDVSSFGTVTMEANADYALILHSEIGSYNSTGISSLTLTEVVPEPSASLTAQSYETYDEGIIALTGKLTAADGVEDITSQVTAVKFESSNTAVANVDNNGVVTGVSAGSADITVTYTYNNEEYTATATIVVTEPDKTQTYYLGSKYMTEAAQDSAGIVTTDDEGNRTIGNLDNMSYANEYSEIMDGLWAVADELSNCSMTLLTGYWRVTGIKESYLTDNDGSLAVLKLKVPYTGTYDIKTRRTGGVSGADVYMIPVDDVAPEAIGQSYLKAFTPAWREVTCADSENSYKKRTTAHIKEGEYYVVFNLNTDAVAVINDKGAQHFSIRGIQLAEATGDSADKETPATTIVSAPTIAVTTNLPGATIDVKTVDSIGEIVTLTAGEAEGYKFIGWKRGVAKDNSEVDGTSKFADLTDNGDGTYSYKVWSNTFLTAVYEEIEVEEGVSRVVRFWNRDGSYLGDKLVDKITEEGGLPTTSYVGYTFREWWVSENVALDMEKLTAAVTNAVAQFDAKQTVGKDAEGNYVAFDAVKVNGVTKSNVYYGTEVECIDETPSKVTHWLRDGMVVSYDPTYYHYVWNGTNIYSSYAPIEKKPLVLLESTTIDGAYMIEYDGARKEIVEVGILFGEAGSTPVVESAPDKYVSQKSDNHGQLAAKPINDSYTVARGYMIYKDGGNTYVIYSE